MFLAVLHPAGLELIVSSLALYVGSKTSFSLCSITKGTFSSKRKKRKRPTSQRGSGRNCKLILQTGLGPGSSLACLSREARKLAHTAAGAKVACVVRKTELC